MHPDDLKLIWMCYECGRKFAYHSDVEDHKKNYNHSKMMLRDLTSRKTPAPFTRGRMSLGFRVSGRMSRVIVEYEYYPASGTIKYIDVRYTDSKLQSMVEGNSQMMKNIDNYLRRLLKPSSSARL
jgi:hypothetical protein